MIRSILFFAVGKNKYGYHAVVLFQNRLAAPPYDHEGVPRIRLVPQIVKLEIQQIFLGRTAVTSHGS